MTSDKEIIYFRSKRYEISTVEDCLNVVNDIIDNGIDGVMRDVAYYLRFALEGYMKDNSNIDNDNESIEMIKHSIKQLLSIFIADLIGKRFSALEDMEMEIRSFFEAPVKVSLALKDEPYEHNIDYSIIGHIEFEDDGVFCDFDIYFAKTRSDEMYITEVSYDFDV